MYNFVFLWQITFMTFISSFNDVIILCIAYFIGSIPFGLIISKLFVLPDPMKTGSYSIGATNILRLGNKWAAFLTLLLDFLKGSAAVLLAYIYDPALAQITLIAAIVGHIWPVWLFFRGGKGAATALGGLLILSFPVAIICAVTWVAVLATTRYSSLSTLLTVLLSSLYAFLLSRTDLVEVCISITVILFWSHRSNIIRLLSGEEPKIGNNNPSKKT